jgi:hypothetical protein
MTSATASKLANWESHLQSMHKQFHELANDQCLLWVDPAQVDLFEENSFVLERKVRVPISHPRFDPQFSPYLVLLNLSKYADAEVFKTSVQAAFDAWDMDNLQAMNGQPISGWIMAETTPQGLAQYWARCCHLHHHNALTKLLRFHDPSVREWLWPTLSPEQQSILMGPAKTIIAFGRNQDLMNHARSGSDHSVSANTSRLALAAKQWAQVDDYAALHAAWLKLCSENIDYRRALEQKGNWAQSILTTLEEATRYGIHDREDRQLFAMHAMQLGGNFHMHPKLHPIWTKTQTGNFYGGAIEEVLNTSADELSVETLNK